MNTKTQKKLVKISTIMMIIIYILFLPLTVYGSGLDPISIIGNGSINGTKGVSQLYTIGNMILGILQYVGAGVAVIATLVLGMKYMYSAPDEKAEIKKKLIPYIIGGVLVFGAVSLVKLVETFTNEILN